METEAGDKAMTETTSSNLSDSCPERRHHPAGALLALLLLLFATLGPAARAADSPTKAKLPTVTVEAARALRLKVDRFVTSVAIQPWGDSLYRWTEPVCPLVAGLPKAQGEFVLARISKAARDAHAPLGGRDCDANLYVVAVGFDPSPMLKTWWAHNPRMYNSQHGIEPIERFIQSTLPIRAWYNTYQGCEAGDAATYTLATVILPQIFKPGQGPPGCETDLRSRIVRMSTASDITSALIVVDGRQLKNVNLRQMADYIALIGLADLRSDVGSTAVPSILDLFGHGKPPQGLTPWDRAFLYSLYNTTHMSVLEVPEMEITMTTRLSPPR